VRRMRPIIFLALKRTYGVAILLKPTIYRLVVTGSGKEFYKFVVRILTAVRVLTVRAF
jgi:hypothetical protein